jgi:tetratricopeptide (TPR) repeat protein
MAEKSYTDQNLIDRYLLGNLTPEEQQVFEKRRQEAEFRDALQFAQDLQVALRAEGRAALKAELQALEAGQQSAKTRRLGGFRSGLWVLAAAAAIILLIWVGSSLLLRPDPGEQLLAMAMPFPNVLRQTTRDADPSREDALSAAFLLYEKQEYAAATQAFQQLLEEGDSLQHALWFYQGQAQMAQGNYQQANQDFLQAAQQGQDFEEAITFYRAVCLWQLGEQEAARKLIDDILAQPNHFYRDQLSNLFL